MAAVEIYKLHFMRKHSQLSSVIKDTSVLQSKSDELLNLCRTNETFLPVWENNGFSHCFYDAILCCLFLIMLVALIIQVTLAKRYFAIARSTYRSRFYRIRIQFQLFCVFMLLIESPVYFGVQYYIISHETTLLSVATCIIRFSTLSVSLWLLTLESVMTSSRAKCQSSVLVSFWGFLCTSEVVVVVSWNNEEWWFKLASAGDQIETAFWATRLAVSCFLIITSLSLLCAARSSYMLHTNSDASAGRKESGTKSQSQSFPAASRHESTWKGLKSKMVLIGPYLWPAKSYLLQMRVLACVMFLVAGRVVNPYVPIFSKNIVNSLTDGQPWGVLVVEVLVYVGLRLLQGVGVSGGLLNCARSWCWIRVQQYTYRSVQIRLFEHLHSLSLSWHLSRKTGEVLRSIDRGTSSINNIFSYLVFSILPTIIDIVIAIVYFVTAFNAWFGLIVFICLLVYLLATIVITEWRTKFRREMNLKDNRAKQLAIDSLLNFETVKYYNAESYEVEKFEKTILNYQESEYKTLSSWVILSFSQSMIINLGLLAGSLLCVRFVVDDKFRVGDYVLFGTYIVQLYTPLNYFGTYYRLIQSSFIDMENMFDLFKEEEEVVDTKDATILPFGEGKVEFQNVSFHYKPENPILKNISFTVEPGHTLALVGPSGMGKSTIIRLLLRFYDVQSGSIRIDGYDISRVTQQSLRAGIGVVPQDTVLFNEDIMSNIRYGRVHASDDDVIMAARAADIHDQIVNMPDKYATTVGERGLKLSGGEKQRVAIARTLLKSPKIVLLDEATSALDTMTERNILSSLSRVCAGRTSIVIAHRLSTIVSADSILVLKEGEIVEQGNHNELMGGNGVYADMWREQLLDSSSNLKNQA